jgi:large subunit ribosomal protein L29|tara:strand:- start:15438 stop:15656 length:219 start_codon:yes stop_codon:yes gene_type:complete
MSLSDIKTIKKLTDDEIVYEIKKTKKQLFDIRFKKATSQMYKSNEIMNFKRKLRQLLTVQNENKKPTSISSN